MPTQRLRVANTITRSASIAKNQYTHAGERVLSMLGDIRARVLRITKGSGTVTNPAVIVSTQDSLEVVGHTTDTNAYDDGTMWTTLRRLQSLITKFISQTLHYDTHGDTGHKDDEENSTDSESESTGKNCTVDTKTTDTASKYSF